MVNIKSTDEQILCAYGSTGSVWKAAKLLGMCGQVVYRRLKKIDSCKSQNKFSLKDEQFLRENYEKYSSIGKLCDLASQMGRTKQFICRQAKNIGLTFQGRKKSWNKGEGFKIYFKTHPRPKGMLGKHHSKRVGKIISEANKKRWGNMSESDRDAFSLRMSMNMQGRVFPRKGVTWKGDWREIGGKKIYFRSRWEYNYACYLEWIKSLKTISSWEHEPKTFWFEGIKRGCLSYLPDFRVIWANGREEYHEVKGWMDARSKTKIERMGRYHPEVKLVVIDSKAYKEMKKRISMVVPGWEF